MSTTRTPGPSVAEQLAALEDYLGRTVPPQLRELYLTPPAASRGLLPLTSGREHDPPLADDSRAGRFEDAKRRFASVLGHAIGNAESASHANDDYVWPPGLLVLEDCGCGVFRAVDLDDAALRIVEYEHLDPVDDPQLAAAPNRLAYREPAVPRTLQHRFILFADSLEGWLRLREAT